jgi:hypothetical protein
LISDEVKNRPQFRVGLINEILSEVIFIRMDQALLKFFLTPYRIVSERRETRNVNKKRVLPRKTPLFRRWISLMHLTPTFSGHNHVIPS